MSFTLKPLAALLITVGVAACSTPAISHEAGALPAPKTDTPLAKTHSEEVAVLSGGCFWGVEAVFEHVKGVKRVWAGYSGGSAATATYDQVSDGDTGHAESVKIIYDPAQVSYGQLLRVFFSVATDPTLLNRQGPDVGTQYRSAIFFNTPEQERVAKAYVAQLGTDKAFDDPIVTQVVPLKAFYPAEAYHQDYARLHPDDRYIVVNDAPKVVNLQRYFPDVYRAQEQVVSVQLH